MKESIKQDEQWNKAAAEFSEYNVDPERMILHKKAIRIQKKDKTDYLTAVNKAIGK